MRRSMRQIPLAAGAPTTATSSFTNSQVAAATAAAGAAIGAANVSASCPTLSNLSQLLQASPLGAGQQDPATAAISGEQQGPLSAAAAAAAALNAVKKNIKQTVATKIIAGALQGKPAEQSKLGSKEDLHAQLSSVSSPCLLAGKQRGPTTLLKAAMAAPAAAAAAPLTPTAMSPAALTPPAPLIKGGSLKLDADARTFLFASAFGPGGAPGATKPPAGQLAGALASASPIPVAVPKQHAGVLGGAPKVPGPLHSFRAAQH
jgi:hypothetical protein